jgi:hypothetical protein
MNFKLEFYVNFFYIKIVVVLKVFDFCRSDNSNFFELHVNINEPHLCNVQRNPSSIRL